MHDRASQAVTFRPAAATFILLATLCLSQDRRRVVCYGDAGCPMRQDLERLDALRGTVEARIEDGFMRANCEPG
jgi:hypothetical protein